MVPNSRTPRGFTLIELLVVIAVIAVLAAILFPVFGKAREKARQTTCLNNQKQLVTAALLFAQDHDELLPAAATVWGDLNLDTGVLICPTLGKKTANGYLYNGFLAGKALGDIASPAASLLTADGLAPTKIGTKNSDIDYRHGKKAVASFIDGHVEVRAPLHLLDSFAIAYWQFDADGVASYLNASVGAAATYDLTANGTFSANAGAAVNPVPRPDLGPGKAPFFRGDPSANGGSIACTGGGASYLRTVGDATTTLNLQNNKWTLEGWFNHTASSGGDLDILFSTRTSSNYGMMLDIRQSGANDVFSLYWADGTNTGSFSPTTAVTIGADVWHHFALTYDSTRGNGQFELFLDGTSLGTAAVAGTINKTNLDANDWGFIQFLGRQEYSQVTNSFAGRADEWRLANVVLTPSQFLNAP